MSADAGSLHTICRVLFWVFRFDQILVIALYFALHFDQIPSCTQYRRNLFYFQASNGFQPFFNTDQLSWRPSLAYSGEIRNAVLMIHGEKAHSRYFSEDAFRKLKGDNKELMIIPGASHVDLYDNQAGVIPFDRIGQFFLEHLK